MTRQTLVQTPTVPPRTNGSGAAAILAAGIGSIALAILAMAGDKFPAVKSALDFYKPTGVLSGVTTCALLIWVAAWAILTWLWRSRSVAAGPICTSALILLVLSLLLTFPPIADLF